VPDTSITAASPKRRGLSERSLQRRRLLAAQDWCQRATLENPRYKYRIQEGLQTGTLHPSIEKAILDIGWGKPQTLDQRLLDAVGAAAGAGLITLLLRRPLTEDPLADPRRVDGTVLEHAPQEPALPALTAGQVASIIPPSRPRKPRGSGPPLKLTEEIMR
jgi:hypothetical protein